MLFLEQTPAADWGKKKFRYYGGDVRGNRIDLQDDGKAALETMEGLKMAKQQESLLTKDDFLGFDVTSDKVAVVLSFFMAKITTYHSRDKCCIVELE